MDKGVFRIRRGWVKCFGLVVAMLLVGCNGGGSGDPGNSESRVLGGDAAAAYWPNDTTTSRNSSVVTSKILISNLDESGEFENIFISVLPNSSNEKSSILRITQGGEYKEIANFQSTQVFFLQDSVPFSADMNGNGQREILLVSFDLKSVHAIEFKNDNLSEFFVRWSAKLPKKLETNFNRQMVNIFTEGKEMVMVDHYGIYENKNGKPKVVDLNQSSDDDDDDEESNEGDDDDDDKGDDDD